MAMSVSELVQSDQIFGSTLLVLAIDLLGPQILGTEDEPSPWTAETLRRELQTYLSVEISEDTIGKLMAAISVVTSDAFFTSLPSFLFTIHGLLGDGTDWSYAEPIDAEDLAWAVMEAILLWPPDEDTVFDPQIVGFCQVILKSEGLMSPPSVLSFAQEDDVYADIGQYGEDILQEQSSRTEEVNQYLEQQQSLLLDQIASLQLSTAEGRDILQNIQLEIADVATHDKWM